MIQSKQVLFAAALGGLFLLGGCATGGRTEVETPATSDEQTPVAPRERRSGRLPDIQLEAGAQVTLGEAFRHIGETYGGGAALTAGLEERPTPAAGLGRSDFVSGFEHLARPYGFKLQVTPHYVFLYPEGYEALAELSLEGHVDPVFDSTRASFAIGAGTDLYNTFALLSESLRKTIIADNIVADAWCGELFLEDAPVTAIVEAILKSSRIAPDMIEVESTDRYLFIRSAANQSRPPSCLNRDQLSAEQLAILQTPLTLRIPGSAGAIAFQAEPATLGKVLPELSLALGVPVTADETMNRLPINIMVFHAIPTETALDLLVRQWLLPRYGYRVENGGLHFCERAGT